MARYRKKPVVVEAERWWPGKDMCGVSYDKIYEMVDADGMHTVREGAYVITIHGQRAFLSPGDWVITEPDGVHHYPCKTDVFAATYDPVE